MPEENPNVKHPYEWANEFDRKRGLALGMALAVENSLEFFISNYFVRPQHAKTFFFDEIITQKLSFTGKTRLFENICEREKFNMKEVKALTKLIDEIREIRNKIAHSETWADPTQEKISLVKRREVILKKDYLELTDEFMDDFDKKRFKAVSEISDFYLKYSKEGTIDEKYQKLVERLNKRYLLKDKLKDLLLKEGIKILEEQDGRIVWEATIDKLPDNHIKKITGESFRREYFHIIPPFIIKSPDRDKNGTGKTDKEEVENEINVWAKNRDIPIVPKVAILKLNGKDEYFLTEECYDLYKGIENLSGELKKVLSERINKIREDLDKVYKNLDHKDDNFIYDLTTDKLYLTDICVAEPITEEQKDKN